MTLEEKIRGLAAKGELTHISIAAKDGMFYANYAPASASGYAQGVDADPVTALEAALAASPIKPKRVRKPAESEPEPAAADDANITAAVTHEAVAAAAENDADAAAAAVMDGEIITAAVNATPPALMTNNDWKPPPSEIEEVRAMREAIDTGFPTDWTRP